MWCSLLLCSEEGGLWWYSSEVREVLSSPKEGESGLVGGGKCESEKEGGGSEARPVTGPKNIFGSM